MSVSIVYGWPEESSVSLDLETNQCTIRVSADDPDPGGQAEK